MSLTVGWIRRKYQQQVRKEIQLLQLATTTSHETQHRNCLNNCTAQRLVRQLHRRGVVRGWQPEIQACTMVATD